MLSDARQHPDHGLLLTFWNRLPTGEFNFAGLSGVKFPPCPEGCDQDFFPLRGGEVSAPQIQGVASLEQVSYFAGTTEFLLKQRILPVVAWVDGERVMRCIGTAFLISGSGYVLTATHVFLDPIQSGYAKVKKFSDEMIIGEHVRIGVLIQLSGITGRQGFSFYPFRDCRYWGQWLESPLIREPPKFIGQTDIAVCRLDLMQPQLTLQPLNLSLKAFKLQEECMSIGYAEMQDIPFEQNADGSLEIERTRTQLFISYGNVTNVFADNAVTKRVPTPGPCFEFSARIPGKMSGAPIFDIRGMVVRGVLSSSASPQRQAYGCMLGPIMGLPIDQNDRTLRSMMADLKFGMPNVVNT